MGTKGTLIGSIHELGYNFGLGHTGEGESELPNTNYMSYGGNARKEFNTWQLNTIARLGNVSGNKLNQGSNSGKATKTTNNWLWHTSTNEAPYRFNVTKGQRIPRPLTNTDK